MLEIVFNPGHIFKILRLFYTSVWFILLAHNVVLRLFANNTNFSKIDVIMRNLNILWY